MIPAQSFAPGSLERYLPHVANMLRDLDDISIRLVTKNKDERLAYRVTPRREEGSAPHDRVVDFAYIAPINGKESDLEVNLYSRFNVKSEGYTYIELEQSRFDALLRDLLEVAGGHLRGEDPAKLEALMKQIDFTPPF